MLQSEDFARRVDALLHFAKTVLAAPGLRVTLNGKQFERSVGEEFSVGVWTQHAVAELSDEFLISANAIGLTRLMSGNIRAVVSAGDFPRPKALHQSRWQTLAFIGAQVEQLIELKMQSFVFEFECERLQQAIRSVGAGIWRLDVGKGVFRGDAAVAKLLGWPGNSIATDFDVVLDLLHPEDRPGFMYAIGRATNLGQNDRHAFRVKDSGRWISTGFERDHQAADDVVEFVGMMRDYTEQRNVELEVQMHQLQLESMVKDLRKSNRIDQMTGLANRVAFDEQVRTEVMSARAKNGWLTLLVIDVDHFKSFNDTFGHAAGDVALKQVATEIARSVRANDLAARFGGEEFCVLSFSFPAVAQKIAERIRSSIEKSNWVHRDITVSVGVCTMQGLEIDKTELFRLADEALYRAKEDGRNRVVVA